MMRSIYDISLKDLEAYLLDNGMKPFHAKQVFRWLYHKRVHSFDEMTDISKKMIEKIKEDFSIDTLKVVTIQTSKDGTKKFLFEMEDGALVESVLRFRSIKETKRLECRRNRLSGFDGAKRTG